MSTKHIPQDDFFDGGWAWMAHPSYNGGNPIPVKMELVLGVRWYLPLDPLSACEFEWDRRDDQWEMVVPPMAGCLVDAAPDLLEALRNLLNKSKAEGWAYSAEEREAAESAIAKATGEQP